MSTPLSTLIVDDEPLALDLMERYVLRTPFLRLEAKCSGGAEALEALAGGGIDVAFLDIQMPGMNGLELSRLAGDRTRVIFTTASNNTPSKVSGPMPSTTCSSPSTTTNSSAPPTKP